MTLLARMLRSNRAAAAVEMALVSPLLLILIMGCLELGNYFLDEHVLVAAVRDGARFAARTGFDNYSNCPGPSTPTGTVENDTRSVVKTGYISGGSDRLAKWNRSTISVRYTCSTSANGTALSGIYAGMATGAPIVTVSATVPYVPILASYGFRGTGYNLNAKQQALVMGI